MNLSPLPFLEERTHTMTNLRIGHGYDVHLSLIHISEPTRPY